MDKFIVYGEELEMLKELSNEEIGILVRAEAEFVKNGTVPSLPEKLIFPFRFLIAHVLRDQKKYKEVSERRKAAGKKGVAAKQKKKEEAKGDSRYLTESDDFEDDSLEYATENMENGYEAGAQKYLEEMADSEYSKGDSRYLTESDNFEDDSLEYAPENMGNGYEAGAQKYLEEMADSEYSKGDSRYLTESDNFEDASLKYVPENMENGYEAGAQKYLEEMADSEYSKGDSRYLTESDDFEDNYLEYVLESESIYEDKKAENSIIKSVPYVPDIFLEPSSEVCKQNIPDIKDFESSKNSGLGRNVKKCFEEFWEAYPKKQEKNSAVIEYMSIFTGEKSHHKIMNALNECKNSKQWKKGNENLIPLPQKWLSDFKKLVDKSSALSSG